MTLTDIFCAFGLHSSRVGAKLDVEGAEYRVLRQIAPHGMLCQRGGLAWVAAELHPNTVDWMKADEMRSLAKQSCLSYNAERSTRGSSTPTEIVEFDDESFLFDGQPLPDRCAQDA